MSTTERALMSTILQDPAVVGSEVLGVFQRVNPFMNDIVRRVYHAWASIEKRESVDIITLAEALEGSSYKVDWMMEVRSIYNEVPSIAHWRQYLSTVRSSWIKREADKHLTNALHSLQSTEDVMTLLSEVSKQLVSIDTMSETTEVDALSCVDAEVERLANDNGLRTGISSLDELLGDLDAGEILTIAARTSVGKSLLSGNIAVNLALIQGVPGLYHTFEMPVAKVVSRMAASLTHINSRRVLDEYRSGNPEVIDAYKKVCAAPIIWDERAHLSIDQITNKIRRSVVKHGIRWVILDHIGFVKLGSGKKNEEIGVALKKLKSCCKELGVVPIIVVQLNRCAANEDPGLHHLKASGDIEEDSSQVVLLHRDVILTNEEREKVAKGESLPLKIAVAKTRYGETGYRQLALFLHSSLIQDRAYDEEVI